MFKQLRNRFLILNLIIISFIMLLAFSSIYLITYNNVQADIERELRRVSEFDRNSGINKSKPQSGFTDTLPPVDANRLQPPPDRSVSFLLVTDENGNIISFSSIFDVDIDFYETAKNFAVSANKDMGKFKLNDTYWAFLIKPHPAGYQIVFLDITSRQGILTNLIYTFLFVALIMLFIIFFVSKFFADRAIKPVQEAFEKQKQFIADASHELKTPLAIINTNADVLLANPQDYIKNQSKWLYYIKSEAERMTKLTNDLLYLAQMDYSDVKMIFTDFNLSQLVENAILTMEAVFFEHGISLEYEIEPNLIICGSCEQIQQAVTILLDNAVKYTNTKGKVIVSLKRQQSNVLLSVANTGEGIPQENISKVFDRFYRTDESRTRKSGGYGLGLAIAKTIIEQHGGKISVKSNPNENTIFYVKLPAVTTLI
ncbi:Integral membrane sensor signal transduction histidine kinase [Tepidanaerobacter acetatoxydans Re1]|uniref:histidine kinase n=1 Tax=Tepidanaerobacter acetatoxydans (strain DSM 21804 / JCM 16047 / Re1) TaxID=1209989 RepID=F4LR16_TEPAE|nr:ATP-binding protein [Tepidanaerobacter acetatoxydans]AEE92169.1 integral membrane sensor signal transduction histidine kinase [Tepidanaerobacter acetatoxydans Re1]CCP27031.1 Integral membrane sensor signal transduction histidine kinase [Tepidanaerobacter acetatoxydans Re1]